MNSSGTWARGRAWWLTGGLLIVAGALVVTLYFFPPEQYAFYPRCLFHVVTGLDCPGCGGLRAAHRLLHGDVAAAFAFNPLLVALLPVFAWVLLGWAVRATTGRAWPHPFRRRGWIWLLLGVILVFSIARNLPWGPLAGLHR